MNSSTMGTSAVTVATVGSGLMAGVQFAVALSVVPTLNELAEADAIRLHAALGQRYDPTMPIIGLTTIAASTVGAVASSGLSRRLLAGTAVAMLGVSGISHLGNVPVNKRIRARDRGVVDEQWTDPRPRWRKLHLARTALAIACLLLSSGANADSIKEKEAR